MKKFVPLPTKEKRLTMNGKIITLTFFEFYSVYKKIRTILFHTYSLTCLNKDTSVLLKVKCKNNGLNYFKNTMYMNTILLIKLSNLRKRKYKSHTIARLTVLKILAGDFLSKNL